MITVILRDNSAHDFPTGETVATEALWVTVAEAGKGKKPLALFAREVVSHVLIKPAPEPTA